MKYTLFNHRAPADHPKQNTPVDSDTDQFAQIIINATGGGMSPQATMKAMDATCRLGVLPVGQSMRLTSQWMDVRCNVKDFDITLTRIEDQP